mgnify:CR=1 FL=1
MSRTWRRYRRAYGDCSEWLAQVFLPWRWQVVFWEACREVRQDVTAP